MKDIYKPDEDCMAFSDETLEKYFFDKVKNIPGVELKYMYFDEHSHPYYRHKVIDKVHRIESVSFDGEKEDFAIDFFNSGMISIAVLQEQFMFIDDMLKKDVRGVEGCIIYEGYLRDKTHEQILGIFFDLVRILHGTKKIKFKEHLVAHAGFYRINAYTVKLTKPNMKRQIIQFENIRFLIN